MTCRRKNQDEVLLAGRTHSAAHWHIIHTDASEFQLLHSESNVFSAHQHQNHTLILNSSDLSADQYDQSVDWFIFFTGMTGEEDFTSSGGGWLSFTFKSMNQRLKQSQLHFLLNDDSTNTDEEVLVAHLVKTVNKHSDWSQTRLKCIKFSWLVFVSCCYSVINKYWYWAHEQVPALMLLQGRSFSTVWVYLLKQQVVN